MNLEKIYGFAARLRVLFVAQRVLFMAQRDHGIDAHRLTRREPRCRNRHTSHERCSTNIGKGVRSGNSIEENPRSAPTYVRSGEKTRHCKCGQCTYDEAHEWDGKRFAQHDASHFDPTRAPPHAAPTPPAPFVKAH